MGQRPPHQAGNPVGVVHRADAAGAVPGQQHLQTVPMLQAFAGTLQLEALCQPMACSCWVRKQPLVWDTDGAPAPGLHLCCSG